MESVSLFCGLVAATAGRCCFCPLVQRFDARPQEPGLIVMPIVAAAKKRVGLGFEFCSGLVDLLHSVVDRRPEVHGERRRGQTKRPADTGTTML